MKNTTTVWQLLGMAIVSFTLAACGGEKGDPDSNGNNTSASSSSGGPQLVLDLLHCPEGYGTPPSNGSTSYFCLGRIPPSDYYQQYCGEATNDYFCPLLEDDYCPSTGTIVADGGECPASSSSSSGGPQLVLDLLHCPEGYGTPPTNGSTSYFCLGRIPPEEYFQNYCDDATNDYFCPLLEEDYCPSTDTIVADGGECPTSSSSSSSQPSNHGLCGVDYDALGNGSWQACYVLQNGTAECLHKENPTQAVQVKWDDGTPVQNAAQISGAGYYEVILITEEGTVHYGSRDRLNKNPKISELGISATGGQNTRCAMVRENNRNDIRCWDGGSDAFRPQLPNDFNAKQLTANYSDVCALNQNGDVWCWEQKPDNSLDFISANPSIAPFSEAIEFVSVGQLQVCGVKASGGVECLARWDSTNYLPSKGGATNEPVNQNGMSDVIGLELGFDQGITIHQDGKAKFWKSGSPTEFAGISNAIAAGGDRDLACVLTADGDVYCLNSSRQPVKVNGNQKARNSDCPLVF